jgi:hypothetical protein
MKKLQLNKKVIAQLGNPDKILGGQPQKTVQCNGVEKDTDDSGIANATNGANQCDTQNGQSWCICYCGPAY